MRHALFRLARTKNVHLLMCVTIIYYVTGDTMRMVN